MNKIQCLKYKTNYLIIFKFMNFNSNVHNNRNFFYKVVTKYIFPNSNIITFYFTISKFKILFLLKVEIIWSNELRVFIYVLYVV